MPQNINIYFNILILQYTYQYSPPSHMILILHNTSIKLYVHVYMIKDISH